MALSASGCEGRIAKTYSTFALSDEAYALTTGPYAQDWSRARIISLQLFLHLYSVASATLGGLLRSLIPDSVHGRSSHRGMKAADRLTAAFPNAVMIHAPYTPAG
jgi:hypothetical protein